ncbi:MAG TPA: VOC family protein [Acidimicrobiales bacterium]|nr:VOC family protein [Acidimicrobiales bacterium]
MPNLRELAVSDDPETWRTAGFTVDDDGVCTIGTVRLRIAPTEHRKGVHAWAFGGDVGGDVDGVPTAVVDPGDVPEPVEHPNGATLIDHVVMATPDLDRTIAALEGAGLAVRRTRDTDTYGAPMRQVFFRAGEVIIELIGPQEKQGDGRSGFFGIAVNVRDLDGLKEQLGDLIGTPKDAVQPGRRITTLHMKEQGLTTAIAFMSEGDAEY